MHLIGKIDSWATNPQEVGPLYPLVGWEVFIVLVCVVLWIGWLLWQTKIENADYAQRVEELKHDDLTKLLDDRK